MRYDICEVQESPPALLQTLASDRRKTGFLQLTLDLVGYGCDLPVGLAGAYDEVVRHDQQLAHVDHSYVERLLLSSGLGRQIRVVP